MKKLLVLLIIAMAALNGCGAKSGESEAPAAAAGNVISNIQGENEEESQEETVIYEEVSDTFVPTDETKKNAELIAQQFKEKEEARENLGNELTTQEYKYDNGSLILSVEKDDKGKKNLTLKYNCSSDKEFAAAYSAINEFAQAMLDQSDYGTATTEVNYNGKTYIVEMKSKSNISYSGSAGGKGSHPAMKDFDECEDSEKEVFTRIRMDAFTFLQLV